MSNEVYTDLERQYLDTAANYLDTKLKLEIIKNLVEHCPNDVDLGAEIRKFINLQQTK
jgi:hypothetical protein